MAKILLIDIETFPNLFYAWRLWEGRALDIKEFSSICCFSAKWLGGKQVTKALPDFNGSEKDLTKALWTLVNEADILIAHNGRCFDFGRMNSQFIKFGLPPPSPTQKIDTKKMATQIFGFDSNSLDNLCQFLGLGKKMNTGGYELWQQCMANDPKAWTKMKKYNGKDVTLLEKLYLTLRAWTSEQPNLSLYGHGGGCPKCGGPSNKIQSRGIYEAKTRVYNRFQCTTCKGWLKEVQSIRGIKAKFSSV